MHEYVIRRFLHLSEREFLELDVYRGAELVRTHLQYEAQWVALTGADPMKIPLFASAFEIENEIEQDDFKPEEIADDYADIKKYLSK